MPHQDSANPAAGMCALTAFGTYNYKLGGHLILYDLKMIVEFPPGSTILLPSATLRHANTPIQGEEHRYSLAQFCAGALIRWVKYGFRTYASLLAGPDGSDRLAEVYGQGDIRWREAVARFSKYDELVNDQHEFLRSPL